ncbi:MAG: transporter [Spirochaetales bacterium]|nr:transporter [Spirochaetales bacterium]
MKKYIILFIVIFMFFPLSWGNAENTDDEENTFGMEFALMFFLPALIDLDNYTDGIQTGAGVKMWFSESFAIRALFHLSHYSNNDTQFNQTDLGLSGAAEYHFSTKQLSPYAGGLVGVLFEMETDVETQTSMYAGGFFGVEMELYKSISLFGEYDFIIAFYEWGYTMDFGAFSEGQIGILLYF